MKTIFCVGLLMIALAVSSCVVYERRTPDRVVVRETVVGPGPRVVTVLPSGYRTRTYRGVNYYYTDDGYYRPYPSGGYTVVPRPW